MTSPPAPGFATARPQSIDGGGGRALTALITAPPPGAPSQRCAVVQVHGGGWASGSPAMLWRRSAALAARGFTAVAVEYRLTFEAPWPAQLHDVKTAIRWVRSHADELDIDPDRIAIAGHSAGAQLALMAAGTVDDPAWDGPVDRATAQGAAGPSDDERDDRPVSCAVAAVIACYPPVDLRSGPSGERLLGAGFDAQRAAAASPITHLSAEFPPTMLLHGLADVTVPPSTSRQLHDALVSLGVETELHLYAGQLHEFDSGATMAELTMATAAVFLERTLIDPARFDAEQAADNPLWPAAGS